MVHFGAVWLTHLTRRFYTSIFFISGIVVNDMKNGNEDLKPWSLLQWCDFHLSWRIISACMGARRIFFTRRVSPRPVASPPPLPRRGVRGYHPRKFFENRYSIYALWCILLQLAGPLTHQLFSYNFQFLNNLHNGKCEKRIKHFIAVQYTIGSYKKSPTPEKSPSAPEWGGLTFAWIRHCIVPYQKFIAGLIENASL